MEKKKKKIKGKRTERKKKKKKKIKNRASSKIISGKSTLTCESAYIGVKVKK